MMDSNRTPGHVEATMTAEEQQKRRLLQKKVQKMRLQQIKSKSPHWLKPKKYRNTDLQTVIEAHYKKRLAKYKETNTQLAHVVADQKLEIAHWYNESVTLKSETQSLQEKLLRYTNLQHDEIIDAEVERRILERCASLNQAVNSSMSSFLEAVEGISKVKELVGTIAKSSRRSKSISNPSSLPPTISGDRSSSESIMRSTSEETVEDNRPRWQSATKLTHMWRQRQQDRVQAAEAPDMSVIGEQSTILDDTHNISVADAASNCPLLEISEVSQVEDDDGDLDYFKTETSEDFSHANKENNVKGDENNSELLLIQGSNADVKKRISSVPMIVEEIIPDLRDEAINLFEGSPCHLPKVKSSRRSSIRSRRVSWAPIEDRGATKMESRGSKMRKSSILHLQLDLSSDFEEDNTENILVAPKLDKKILGENVSLSESISSSPRASPATMLSRLEELENKGGRKGKRSRSKSTFGEEPTITGVLTLPKEEYNNDDRLLMPPPTISPAPQFVKPAEPSFLIADNDLTMNEHLDMSMSDSVTNAIIVPKLDSINYINNGVKDNCKVVKKFFQNPLAQENSTKKEIRTTLNKNTPYDLSLLEETGVSIIPFSSDKDIKENCPPTATTHKRSENDSETKVRRCSVLLSDINSPNSKDMVLPDLVVSPEVRLSLCSPIEKIRSSGNRKKSLFVRQAESNCLDSSPILDKETDVCKIKENQNGLKINDNTQKHKDNEAPTKKSLKSRPSLSLKSKNRKSENKQENEDACSTSGRRRTKVIYVQQHLDSSGNISFSDDGDESWIKTPLKKKKSLVKPHSEKSVGTIRQSLSNAKTAEASEISQGIETQKQKKSRNSRSKKSKLEEAKSADICFKTGSTDKTLLAAPEPTLPEPKTSLTILESKNSKKSRNSHSKKSKLNEDTSAGDGAKQELTDKALITAFKQTSPEPEPSITKLERKSTENSKKSLENRRKNLNSTKKDSSSSSQASCTSSDELPVLKSTNGTEINSQSPVKKNMLVSEDDDLAEEEKENVDDNAQSPQDESKRPFIGEKRLVTGTEAEEVPRKKRAASKNITFKEPTLNRKMRNEEEVKLKENKIKSSQKKLK